MLNRTPRRDVPAFELQRSIMQEFEKLLRYVILSARGDAAAQRWASSLMKRSREQPLDYVEKHLLAGETVVYRTRLHWVVLIGHSFVAAALVIAGVGLLAWSRTGTDSGGRNGAEIGAVVLLAIAAGVVGMGMIRRNATIMVVTNKRVLIKVGLASRRTLEMLFSKIESILIDEPAMGRLLGYGTVIVRGVGGTPESFPGIAHPLEFRRQVQQQIEDNERGPSGK